MTNRDDKLTIEELEELEGEHLPFRTAMSAIMTPPPPGADPRVVDGGVDLTGEGVSPDGAGAHIPESGT